MESPKPKPAPSSLSLPPGCRFYPSEEQLLNYYLQQKNHDSSLQSSSSSSSSSENPQFYGPIKEINLYNFNPFELPEFTCFRFGYRGRKRHWYCFTERINGGDEGKSNNNNNRRKAGFGYWKRKGRVRDVMCNAGKAVLGSRKCFMFYLEKLNGKTAVRTDWLMYEYALIDNSKASFVLCRVFGKSRGRNSISEHALSSCAEESIATVRHIGIQHDGSTLSVLDEDKAHDSEYAGEVAGQRINLNEETKPYNPVKFTGLAGSTALLVGSLTTHHLSSLVEGDFLELDDLCMKRLQHEII